MKLAAENFSNIKVFRLTNSAFSKQKRTVRLAYQIFYCQIRFGFFHWIDGNFRVNVGEVYIFVDVVRSPFSDLNRDIFDEIQIINDVFRTANDILRGLRGRRSARFRLFAVRTSARVARIIFRADTCLRES